MVEWLAGNRIRGTSTERASGDFNNHLTGVGAVGGWKEVGRTTLESVGDFINVSSLPDKRYYMILHDVKPSGNVWTENTFNNDLTGGNTANRRHVDGSADGNPQTSANYIYTSATQSTPMFGVYRIANKSDKEKLQIYHNVMQSTAGAGTAPRRYESFGKWDNNSDPISTFNLHNGSTGDFGIGSEAVVLGWDPDDTHTGNFWEELADVSWTSGSTFATPTFAAKKYLWIQMYKAGTSSSSISCRLNFNDDTTSVYARRLSANGAGDWTGSPPYDGIHLSPDNTTVDYCNIFMINNPTTEKLIIAHIINQSTAGSGTAPNRMELVGKWVPSSNQQVTKVHMTSVNDALIAGSRIKVWGSN